MTFGFADVKRFDAKPILPYIIFQIAGAFFATAVLKFLFPVNINPGATIPAGSSTQSFIPEFILNFK